MNVFKIQTLLQKKHNIKLVIEVVKSPCLHVLHQRMSLRFRSLRQLTRGTFLKFQCIFRRHGGLDVLHVESWVC